MNIYEKLSAITSEISNVAKNLEVGYGNSRYKAVGEADVLASVKPLEIKYGVYSYPLSREIIESEFVTKYDKDGKARIEAFLRTKTVYRFVNMEKPDEYVDMEAFGDGVDAQDKAPGKAMTYSDKYSLLKAYKIITGEDPDKDASEPMYKRTPPPAPKVTKAQAEELADLVNKTNTDEQKFHAYYGVSNYEDFTITAYEKACRQLEKKLPAETIRPIDGLEVTT